MGGYLQGDRYDVADEAGALITSGTLGVTCGTNAGTFTVSDAFAVNTGTWSSSTGYDTTSATPHQWPSRQ